MRYRVPDLAPETWHTAEIDVEKSQFLAWVCHAPTTDAFDALLQAAKAAHPNASHHCTAFIAGPPGAQTQARAWCDEQALPVQQAEYDGNGVSLTIGWPRDVELDISGLENRLKTSIELQRT